MFSESLYVLYNLYKVLENCIIKKKLTSHLNILSSAVEITGNKWLCAMHIFVMYPVLLFFSDRLGHFVKLDATVINVFVYIIYSKSMSVVYSHLHICILLM